MPKAPRKITKLMARGGKERRVFCIQRGAGKKFTLGYRRRWEKA